jgi:hypothetical protein
MTTNSRESLPAPSGGAPEALVRTLDYYTIRRVVGILGIGFGALLIAVGVTVGLGPGMFPLFALCLALGVFVPPFSLELYPALSSLPHHVSANDFGLLMVHRYLFADHYQKLPWTNVVVIKSLGNVSTRGPRYLVSYHPIEKPNRTEAFAISAGALSQLRQRMPKQVQIV